MLIVMQGVPGSGKSTFARKMLNGFNALAAYGRTAVICSTDDYFLQPDGSYKFDPSKLAEYHKRNLEEAKTRLAMGYTVIVDNCNIKNEHCARYVRFAYDRGIPVVFVRCTGRYASVHNVPAATIERMRGQMEELTVGKCLELTQHTVQSA